MKALFISLKDLSSQTALTGNIDPAKLLPAIRAVQEIELPQLLGTDLYNKISADIIEGTLTGVYLKLKQEYIHNLLIHLSVAYYLPYSSYIISNGGVSKWTGGENHSGVTLSELNFMVNKETEIASMYKKMLVDYLCYNSSDFPEYSTNTNEDTRPNDGSDYTSLFLG